MPAYGIMQFDGVDDYVDVPLFTFSRTQGTVMCWFYTNRSFTPDGLHDTMIFRTYDLTGTVAVFDFFPYYSNPAADQGYFGWYNNTVEGRIVINPTTAGMIYGAWNHVVYTYIIGGTCCLYVNGVLAASNTPPDATYDTLTGDATHIGDSGQGIAVQTLSGYVDDLRVYNRALSQSEISSIFLSHSRLLNTDGFIAYYKLDQGSEAAPAGGLSVPDSSGNGFTATPINGPIWKASNEINYP